MKTHHCNARLSIYGMRDATIFMLKGGTPIVTRVSLYLRNRRHAIEMCVSLLSQKQTRLRY
jgi:hypothetical protein